MMKVFTNCVLVVENKPKKIIVVINVIYVENVQKRE